MNSLLNTPLQLPLPLLSPFFTSKLTIPSPFISPYAGPHGSHSNLQDQQFLEDDFDNFQLDQPEQIDQINQKQQQQVSLQSIKKKDSLDEEKQINQDSDDASLQSQEDTEISQKIKRIINLLVKHGDKNDQRLSFQKNKCVGNDRELGQVFDVLARKFRKLKKTKQQMTKYCMRKAFKFLAEKHKKILENNDTNDFLREYFQRMESQSFSIPFKKNSEEKTMNSSFLKKIFSSQTFACDYKQFIKNFGKVVEEDNNKKVKYLTCSIESFLQNSSIKKLQTVKRLPWTQLILDRTVDLANKLLSHSPLHANSENAQRVRKASKQKKQKESTETLTCTRRKSTLSTAEIPINNQSTQNFHETHD